MLVSGSGGEKVASVQKEDFGKADGKRVELYTLTNSHGVEAKITTYGGIVVSLKVPDRNGKLDDVVLGFENLDDYLKGHPYFGAIIGRYGNRIAKGRFTLNGAEYKLATNNAANHLACAYCRGKISALRSPKNCVEETVSPRWIIRRSGCSIAFFSRSN